MKKILLFISLLSTSCGFSLDNSLIKNKSLEGNPVSINSGLKPSPKEFGGNHGLKIRGILNTNKINNQNTSIDNIAIIRTSDIEKIKKNYNINILDKLTINSQNIYKISLFDNKPFNVTKDISTESKKKIEQISKDPSTLNIGIEKVMLNESAEDMVDLYDNSGNIVKYPVPNSSQNSWWLNETSGTNIIKSWEYSQAENINIAVFDRSFGKLDKYEDFKGRVNIHPEYMSNCRDTVPLDDPVCSSYMESPKHGFWVSSLIASNGYKTNILGVAPKSRITPIAIFSSWDFLKKLSIIKDYRDPINKKPIDIVNISSGLVINRSDYKGKDCIKVLHGGMDICDPELVMAQQLINDLSNNHKVIIVASAGNEGINTSSGDTSKFHFPSGLTNVIGVGAYEMSEINKGYIKRADLYPKSTQVRNIIQSSSYGSSIDIWSAGDNIPIFYPKDINDTSRQWVEVKGTSFATPIVTGSVALLKSLKRDLNVRQIAYLLYESGIEIKDPSFKVDINNKQKALNSLESIKLLKTFIDKK
ncbi:MAG: S8/S53 family peptidase [Candidatus Sericytochromatia bacterium]